MKYLYTGILFSLGAGIGDVMFHFVDIAISKFVKKHVPRKYWDKKYAMNSINSNTKKSKIVVKGFYKD